MGYYYKLYQPATGQASSSVEPCPQDASQPPAEHHLVPPSGRCTKRMVYQKKLDSA